MAIIYDLCIVYYNSRGDSVMGFNERITEDIVRKHFEKDIQGSKVRYLIEEQKSKKEKIDKYLKNASKKGAKRGYPDFIISNDYDPDFIIVIECKADITKHQSQTLDRYSEYAVDGALLYASYLSKEFDVLAIGVSGEDEQELKVSHYLYLKGKDQPIPFAGGKLLSVDNYYDAYIKSDAKLKQDLDELLDYSKELNVQLHTMKIPEKDRALLLSGILIALEDKSFRDGYIRYEPQDLTQALVDAVFRELRKSNINPTKLDNLKVQFDFIRTHTTLSTKEDELKNLITNINDKIKNFIKTHKYYDVLGQLYIEFLRYANSDKGLGIVLTPRHITELFTDLACVNKDSVVYDNCAGTGGFLVSALKKMIEDARHDNAKERNIKENQIVGVEYQAHIFALACSNMYIHQDGKSNIYNGDCFDSEIIKEVKEKFRPNIGFLNPPYQVDKKRDKEELDFVLNNLETLQQGGTCVAIVPMQCALAQKGKKYELKQLLLQKHTLEAVLSMPDELFYDSNVGVVTCIMIFTAHKPHPENKETYFGYYKDDGFVIVKNKGRIDEYNKWESIKSEWVRSCINRKEITGFSVNKVIGPEDEWCAELHMETDYSKLNNTYFERTILNYVSFLFQNKLIDQASKEPFNKIQIPLDKNNWIYFGLKELFEISGTKTTPLDELKKIGPGKYPYITTQSTNNGACGFYDMYTEKGNVLTIDSAVSGYCSYQPLNFSASDHVEKLKPNFEMNPYIALFLVTVINLEQYRYNYGIKCSQTRLRKARIKLPSKGAEPDYDFMEMYIKSLPYSSSILMSQPTAC